MALETVCIVFTDLVGSTELANRIGPAQAEALRKEHFGLLRTACADAGGREVKNLGDGLMLVFSSASAALEASAHSQQAIAVRNRRADVRFDVRIGVAFGEVNAEDHDYFGEPVVQAARLCAMAEGGQVLLTDLVKVLASSTSYGFASLGGLALKGLDEPVPAHALMWDASGAGAVPLPSRLRGAPEVAYVGRAAERTALRQSWQRAERGEESLVLLVGEPGIGKTRLSSHHAFEVHEAGGVVLYGAVDEGVGIPYQPWIEALSHYLTNVDDHALDRCLASTGADIGRLIPAIRRRRPDLPETPASDAETERYLLFEAVTEVFKVAARQAPVLVIVDDLHWADKPTLHLLVHLHRALADTAVQFVGTFRDSEIVADHPLADTLSKLHREERVTSIPLSGLAEAEIVELLEFASGQATTSDAAELARVLARDTAGNPLFVAEVLRDLFESGKIAITDQGNWGLATEAAQLPTPTTVRDVVEQRVRRLGSETHRLLTAAAVIGREFELDLLAHVAEVESDAALERIESAIAGSLITEAGSRPGVFRFVHALIAQALVDGLTATRRATLHHRVGEALVSMYGDNLGERTAAVARHQALAGDDPRVVAASARRAGIYALEALAPDEACRWFERARQAMRDGPIHDPALDCDLQADLGIAMRDAGDPAWRKSLTAAAATAAALGDAERLGRALVAMQGVVPISVPAADAELISLMDEALRLASEPSGTRARLLALRAAEAGVAAPLSEKRALVDEAIRIARTLDDATLVVVLVSATGALVTPQTLDERKGYIAELSRLAPAGSASHRAYSLGLRIMLALEEGDGEGLTRAVEEARALRDLPPHARWMFTALESTYERAKGNLPRSEDLATVALEISIASGNTAGLPVYSIQLSDIRQVQGRAGELVDLIRQAYEDNSAMRPIMRATLTVALVQARLLDEARQLLEEAHAEGLTEIPQGIGWAVAVNDYAVAAARCGHTDAAQVLYEMALPYRDRMLSAAASIKGSFCTTLGLLAATLGRREEAVRHFADGDGRLQAFGAPLLQARNSYEHGRALLHLGDAGDRDAARQLLIQARDAYEHHECPAQVANCDELLATI